MKKLIVTTHAKKACSNLQVVVCHRTAAQEQAKEGLLCLLPPQGTLE